MVGAGLGGSAAAYFLQQHFGPQVQLDVYEAAGVGGRLATVTVNKQQYESRGASIHALSLHMQDFVKILGERGRPSACVASPAELGDGASPVLGAVGRVSASPPWHPKRVAFPLLSVLLCPGREGDGVVTIRGSWWD